MPDIEVRKGQAPPAHTREEFRERFRARFFDPAFRGEDEAIGRLEEIAWQGYCGARKSPVTAQGRSRLCRSRTTSCRSSGTTPATS